MRMVFEKVVADEQASFRCLEWNEPDFDCPHHFHPEIEITHILAGSGERLVGDCFNSFAPGDLAMFGRNLPHYYKNWRSGRAHSRVVQFQLDAFGDGFFDLPECHAVRQLLQDACRGLRFSETVRRAACRIITRMFRASTGARRISFLIELLDILSSDSQREQMASHDFMAPDNSAQGERLGRVLNFLDSHWQEKISLVAVAEVAQLHPQSLSRYFRRHLGMTCQEYLIELRLSRAAREILESSKTVSDIAFGCGFNNLANFNRLFLARYQLTPSDYRCHMSGAS